MGKVIEKDGKSYRMRRGKLVEIPEKWVGVVTHPQTIKKRPSKAPSDKQRKIRGSKDISTTQSAKRDDAKLIKREHDEEIDN